MAPSEVVKPGETDCDPRNLVTKPAAQPCPDGQVREVVDGSYGGCVDIQECACQEAEACPNPGSFTCWQNIGRCNYWGP